MTTTKMPSQPLVMIGAGGHAKVLHALALAADRSIVGVCDPQLVQQGITHWRGVPVLGGDGALAQFDPAAVGLVNGIGQLVGSLARQEIYVRLRQLGFKFPALIHPAAWVAPTALLGDGVQIMAGAIVQPDCCIGENSIINTHACIDHDCQIGAHVHIAPGATLCGAVVVGSSCFVGSGSTVIQGIRIGERAVVGAGVALVRDLTAGHTILGAAVRKYGAI